LLYGIIIKTEPEASERLNLSYEDLIKAVIDHLMSNEQMPLILWRRCCSSVHMQTMTVETCNKIRKLAGVAERSGNDSDEKIRKLLDNAVNNWYLKGKFSLSDEGIIKPSDSCRKE